MMRSHDVAIELILIANKSGSNVLKPILSEVY